jgi:hypothetical protein
MPNEIKKSWQRPPTMPQFGGFVPSQLDRTTTTRNGMLWSVTRNEPLTHLDLLADGSWRFRQVAGGDEFGGGMPCLTTCTVDEAAQFISAFYPADLSIFEGSH